MRAHLRTGLSNAGKMIEAAESSLAPRKSGALGDTIRVKVIETSTSISVNVRPSKFYALFVDQGVVSHGTTNNKRDTFGKVKGKSMRRGLAVRVRELRAQGQFRIKPTHFIQRAWDESQAGVEAEIAKAVSDAVAEVD